MVTALLCGPIFKFYSHWMEFLLNQPAWPLVYVLHHTKAHLCCGRTWLRKLLMLDASYCSSRACSMSSWARHLMVVRFKVGITPWHHKDIKSGPEAVRQTTPPHIPASRSLLLSLANRGEPPTHMPISVWFYLRMLCDYLVFQQSVRRMTQNHNTVHMRLVETFDPIQCSLKVCNAAVKG